MVRLEIKSRRNGDEVVIMGDMNAKLGVSINLAEHGLVGPYSAGMTSGNGKLMKSFLRETNMVNVAGFSRPPNRKAK